MRYLLFVLPLAQALVTAAAYSAPDESIRLELNAVEDAEGRCRVSFVVENKGPTMLETLKLELALFNRDGIVQRRLATELGPVRNQKTIVKTFNIDSSCGEIGSILLNDVTACAPGDANACLDRLALSSRVQAVRFYK